jgi:hypothetical protein
MIDGSEVRVRDGVAVNGAAATRWCSVAEAAQELGVPERAIYRRIATQSLRARRDEQGALLVCLDSGAAPEPAVSRLSLLEDHDAGLTPDRARVLTEFASGLLEPLVSRLAQQEAIIREQAEELGRLRARAELTGETDERLAPAFARQLSELAAIREEIESLASRRRWWPFG